VLRGAVAHAHAWAQAPERRRELVASCTASQRWRRRLAVSVPCCGEMLHLSAIIVSELRWLFACSASTGQDASCVIIECLRLLPMPVGGDAAAPPSAWCSPELQGSQGDEMHSCASTSPPSQRRPCRGLPWCSVEAWTPSTRTAAAPTQGRPWPVTPGGGTGGEMDNRKA
jgi:hypothetical protein